ncbi:PREDICTED: deoxycytidylate deaminase [Eufriesea mexicana]|uniref:deoxycytidylate deaminase n=1 Tax=Eufriesea mexicana TaxID=516756 RepID=UPI00083C28C8|nr:PREDICTED: deoxycytidylate deaminase [Eufriesea mexicana]
MASDIINKMNNITLKDKAERTCDNEKRKNYLNWDDYFMAVAFLSAKRSKDPITQVGACLVNEEQQIVGIGYNGMPKGCNDNEFPWGKCSDDPLNTKTFYVCHAEINAILNKNSSSVKNCTLYVVLFPCNECAKVIIQSGIKLIKYMSDKHAMKKKTIAAKRMFDAAGVTYSQYISKTKKITIDFNEVDDDSKNK